MDWASQRQPTKNTATLNHRTRSEIWERQKRQHATKQATHNRARDRAHHRVHRKDEHLQEYPDQDPNRQIHREKHHQKIIIDTIGKIYFCSYSSKLQNFDLK